MSVAVTAAVFSALHVLAMGIGLPGIVFRARALSRNNIKDALSADNAWGIAALLWVGTGLARLLGGFEKGTDFYLTSPAFQVKLGLLGAVLLLELWPMATLLWWRVQMSRGQPISQTWAPWFARISWVQVILVVLIPLAAALTARGVQLW